MFDYFHYFADKPNLPSPESILSLEKDYDFDEVTNSDIELMAEAMFIAAKKFAKPVGVRIIKDGQTIFESLQSPLGEDSLGWLSRKEKVVNETGHSSYYIFLDNITSHRNDHMIMDESYGICGGSFPLIISGVVRGTVTCTGLRPEEDHYVVIEGLESMRKGD